MKLSVGTYLPQSTWNGNESETGIDFFCKPCPTPQGSALCAGDVNVTGLPGWWLVQGDSRVFDMLDARRAEPRVNDTFRTYRCAPGVCLSDNTCANGRSGVVCGGCPDGSVLEVGVCLRCPDYTPESLLMWRVIFCLAGGLIVSVVWFILCWAPVFGGTAEEYFMRWFGWPIRMFNKSKKLAGKAKAVAKKKKQVQDFFSNPKNVKLVQQYAKVLIAYTQVLGSFVSFKVEWPSVLGDCIGWVMNVSTLIKFDFMELPGLACIWAAYSHSYKTYVTLAMPIFVSVLLAIPVGVAWTCRRRRNLKAKLEMRNQVPAGSQEDTDIVNWNERYERTVDVFWNNFMFWLFLIYPGTSLATFQTFICDRFVIAMYA